MLDQTQSMARVNTTGIFIQTPPGSSHITGGMHLVQDSSRTTLFLTMRSRDHDVVIVRRTINLGSWELGMGREWGGIEKGEVSLRVT